MANINTDVLFITVEYIRQNCQISIPEQLDNGYIQNSIIQSQIEDLQKVIGTPLYDSIYNYDKIYLVSGTSIPTDYDNLLVQYLKPLLMYLSIYRALENIEYKVMNTSIVVKKDANNSNQITLQEFNNLKRIAMKNIEFWSDITARFITTQNSNYGKFPEISNFQAYPDTILPDRGRGFSKQGLYLKQKRNKNWGYFPNNSYDFGTTAKGWNINRGTGDNNCCY